MIDPQTREQLQAKLTKDDKNEALEAFEALLKEIENNGLVKMVELDPYFGEVTTPFAPQCELLMSQYPEAFAFFDALLKEMREEMEIFFETTELYDDEEFEQFEKDIREIKERFTQFLREEHGENMENLAHILLA